MKKVVVVGHFDYKNNVMTGAAVKARNILEVVKQHFDNNQIGCIDIENWRTRKISVLFSLAFAFFRYLNIVFVCSNTSSMFLNLIKLFKIIFKNKVHYCVVGANIINEISLNRKKIEDLKPIDFFYVETKDCVEGLIEFGFKNVYLLRNFKFLTPMNMKEISFQFEEPFRFCTFSRIVELKGIADAIRAIERINSIYKKKICVLDLYGYIEKDYKEEFELLIKTNESCNYCGVVDSNNSVNILKNYYCLLFPTKFQTEGIPGTIIDGFAAGVPVICSDWVRCRQIIEDGYNGIIFRFDDFDDFVSKIIYAINNKNTIFRMKYNALATYSLYKPEIASKPLIENLSNYYEFDSMD